jgi:hypothetical protein
MKHFAQALFLIAGLALGALARPLRWFRGN